MDFNEQYDEIMTPQRQIVANRLIEDGVKDSVAEVAAMQWEFWGIIPRSGTPDELEDLRVILGG